MGDLIMLYEDLVICRFDKEFENLALILPRLKHFSHLLKDLVKSFYVLNSDSFRELFWLDQVMKW